MLTRGMQKICGLLIYQMNTHQFFIIATYIYWEKYEMTENSLKVHIR